MKSDVLRRMVFLGKIIKSAAVHQRVDNDNCGIKIKRYYRSVTKKKKKKSRIVHLINVLQTYRSSRSPYIIGTCTRFQSNISLNLKTLLAHVYVDPRSARFYYVTIIR